MRFLLDGSVLIALSDDDHTAHERSMQWFERSSGLFATCPVTQGALIRWVLRLAPRGTISRAKQLLEQIEARNGHEFWPDAVSYADLPEAGVRGHNQVTNAYLVALARHHKGKLVTLDRSLAVLYPDVAVLIP